MKNERLESILNHFDVLFSDVKFSIISRGYINDTYLVTCGKRPKYILQRINRNVFKNCEGLHNNVMKVLSKLNAPNYTSITLFKTKANKSYLVIDTDIWRVFNFIENSASYNYAISETIAYQAGRVLGKFHKLLSAEIVNNYVDTIDNLNYLPSRILEFKNALDSCSNDRKTSAKTQIEFADVHLHNFDNFYDSNLPKRVCHNDTKLNNVLFDKKTGNGLCFIDLDTIMSGYFHYDFGDLVRTVVSESNEDEADLSKIKFSKSFFSELLNGINAAKLNLTDNEKKYLPISCTLMPFMHGLRALTDYLNGNIYYKVTYENQNLDRCKSLFKFAELTMKHQDFIKSETTKLN